MNIPDNLFSKTNRRIFELITLNVAAGFAGCQNTEKNNEAGPRTGKPNFIVILFDDLGYGDLGCYGHPTILTPNIDRLASEGQRWTNFYVAANVSTPSRAGLMTGRLPIRNGMDTNGRRVFFPDSDGGLPESEITIASMLKEVGYQTACIGKWHLGHLSQYLPVNHGFDYYFGIPYSNDMDPTTDLGHQRACMDPKIEYFNVPLIRNDEIIERPADQRTITRRYTEEAIKFIRKNKDHPFFLYMAHSMPHVPLFVSEEFQGKSERGLYGDVVQELDWSVGQVLDALKKERLEENTLVVLTSDNGPWVVMNQHGGSAGLLYGAKATSYEGGMRVPAIFCWSGKIQPGVVNNKIGSTLDLFSTFCKLSGAKMPGDRIYDGYDLSSSLLDEAVNPRNEMFYYHGLRLFAVRKGNYKLYFYKNNPAGYPQILEKLETYTLFDLQVDPAERFDIAEKHPEIVKDILEMVEEHHSTIVPVENQLDKIIQP